MTASAAPVAGQVPCCVAPEAGRGLADARTPRGAQKPS